MNITYIIGTDSGGEGAEEIEGVEAYRDEVESELWKEFPGAKNISVVVENGPSRVFVTDIDWDTDDSKIIEEADSIANHVWNHGKWHYA